MAKLLGSCPLLSTLFGWLCDLKQVTPVDTTWWNESHNVLPTSNEICSLDFANYEIQFGRNLMTYAVKGS